MIPEWILRNLIVFQILINQLYYILPTKLFELNRPYMQLARFLKVEFALLEQDHPMKINQQILIKGQS